MANAQIARRVPLWLDRLTAAGLFVAAGAIHFSIVVGEAALMLSLAAWAASLAIERERPVVPPWFWPLLVYAALTLVAAAFSLDRMRSLGPVKQMFLYLAVPAVCSVARGKRAHALMNVIITVGAVSAIVGVVEYGVLNYDSLGQRPRGTLGHYMTYSGLLMMVVCATAARLLYTKRERLWPALVMPALVAALALTFTRNAWVGACAGVGLVLLMRDFRLFVVLPIVGALFLLLAPGAVTQRAYSMFNLNDPTNRDRLAMVEAGTAIVKRYPLTGIGPNVMPEVYAQFRTASAVEPIQPHLHNVPLQIAAERGLPALAAWLWFVVAAGVTLWRRFRTDRSRYLAAAGLGVLAATLAAGMFEYNFGDSEFLLTLFILLTLPWAAAREPSVSAQTS